MIRGAENRAPYWMLRRSIRLFEQLTWGVDLSEYRVQIDEDYSGDDSLFRALYDELSAHGFEKRPYEEVRVAGVELRRRYDAQMEPD